MCTKKKKKKKKRNTSERGYNRVRPLPIVVFIPDANLPGFFGLLAAPTGEGGKRESVREMSERGRGKGRARER